MIDKIDKIIDELVLNGSNIEEKKDYLRTSAVEILKNNHYDKFILDLENYIEGNLNDDSGIKNISVGIKIQNFEIVINKGNADFIHSVYDVASITKLFTLKLCYEFKKLGILNFNSNVKDILPDFIYLDDYKIIDILKMQGFIETDGKLSDTKSKDELIERLKTVKVKDYDKRLYTDIGFNILPLILENVYEKRFQENLTFEQLCNKYIFKPCLLTNTCFNPSNKILLGSNDSKLPSDQKAKILGGVSGAAGIFTNTTDMFALHSLLKSFTFFDKKFVEEILNYYFFDTLDRKRSYAGIYLNTKDNNHCYASDCYSNYTLAHQGYTGSAITFDLKNNIHYSILVDAMNSDNKKAEKFFDYFHKLRERISIDSIVLYIVYQIKNVK